MSIGLKGWLATRSSPSIMPLRLRAGWFWRIFHFPVSFVMTISTTTMTASRPDVVWSAVLASLIAVA